MSVNQEQLAKLKVKIPYDEDIFESQANWELILTDLLTDSAYILLETLYPFEDFEDYEIPSRYLNWQLRCCVELYNLADKQGVTNYAENTISWTKLSDGLSNALMNKLVSRVGVPRKAEASEEEVVEEEQEQPQENNEGSEENDVQP